jgi:hypothetical protein
LRKQQFAQWDFGCIPTSKLRNAFSRMCYLDDENPVERPAVLNCRRGNDPHA